MFKGLLKVIKNIGVGILLSLSLCMSAQEMPLEERVRYNHADTIPKIITLDQYCWYDSVTLIIDTNFQSVPDGTETAYPDGEIITSLDSLGRSGIQGYIEFYNNIATYPPIPADHEWYNISTESQLFRFIVIVYQTEYITLKFISGGPGTGAHMYLYPPIYHGGNQTLVVYDTVYVDHIHDIGNTITIEGDPPCHIVIHTEYILDPEVGDVKIYIPNTFTPNNDRTNETFKPYFKNKLVRSVTVEIYDRWGGFIFKGPEWNGTTNNNQRCAEGAYAFIIRGILPSGEEFMRYGNINLIR